MKTIFKTTALVVLAVLSASIDAADQERFVESDAKARAAALEAAAPATVKPGKLQAMLTFVGWHKKVNVDSSQTDYDKYAQEIARGIRDNGQGFVIELLPTFDMQHLDRQKPAFNPEELAAELEKLGVKQGVFSDETPNAPQPALPSKPSGFKSSTKPAPAKRLTKAQQKRQKIAEEIAKNYDTTGPVS